ncbi:endonuclease/exonuclease/phosphatase family protein [Streptomyces sp. NPDC048638]|uniref:endonuclease/exonuclease/phosphatase family protein n=1 Tax=Streptomyces sp. NPDC048638 TaxID=3365580 RepID=UPI00371273A6
MNPTPKKPTKNLTVVSWNQENNGKGDSARRCRGHELLKSLNPSAVLRQEMWDAGSHGGEILFELEEILGLRGALGRRSCTAVFFDFTQFAVVRDWQDSVGPDWLLPPTALTLRYRPAGPTALPIVVASYHLPYASSEKRLAEAEWLTTWADKAWQTPDGRKVILPMIGAGDHNSYPVPGTPGDPVVPELESISDLPHRLHRSYLGPNGTRLMDTRPDDVLRTAGLQDVARYWATAAHGSKQAVAPTVNASDAHGPGSRIDRAYVTPQLLPALTGVDVIEVDPDLSDHHILRFTLDREVVADILNERPATTSSSSQAAKSPAQGES